MKTSHCASIIRGLQIAIVLAGFIAVSSERNVCYSQTLPNDLNDPQRTWRMGAFFAGGLPPDYSLANSHVPVSANVKLRLFMFGFEVGKAFGTSHGRGILKGQLEMRA
jgi:hypothetical protein